MLNAYGVAAVGSEGTSTFRASVESLVVRSDGLSISISSLLRGYSVVVFVPSSDIVFNAYRVAAVGLEGTSTFRASGESLVVGSDGLFIFISSLLTTPLGAAGCPSALPCLI